MSDIRSFVMVVDRADVDRAVPPNAPPHDNIILNKEYPQKKTFILIVGNGGSNLCSRSVFKTTGA